MKYTLSILTLLCLLFSVAISAINFKANIINPGHAKKKPACETYIFEGKPIVIHPSITQFLKEQSRTVPHFIQFLRHDQWVKGKCNLTSHDIHEILTNGFGSYNFIQHSNSFNSDTTYSRGILMILSGVVIGFVGFTGLLLYALYSAKNKKKTIKSDQILESNQELEHSTPQ